MYGFDAYAGYLVRVLRLGVGIRQQSDDAIYRVSNDGGWCIVIVSTVSSRPVFACWVGLD